MSYLARLKARIAEKHLPLEPTEPTEGASVSSVGAVGCRLSESAQTGADVERAAIIEHDAGYPAAVADGHANEGWRPEDWRAWLSELVDRRHQNGNDDADAIRFAYSAAINEWHVRHGVRHPSGRCPGCDKPINRGSRVLAMPVGEPVHGVPCLARYGIRWKTAAADGLARLSISAPEGWVP